MNIGYIGIGKLGLPCAESIVEKGHSVKGYDIQTYESDLVEIVEDIKTACTGSDIVFVAVPTPHDPDYDGRAPTAHLEPKDFSYDIVNEVLLEANKHMDERQLLVLISTVLPGTVRREFVPKITNTRFVYNPYLIAMGSVAWDMINPEMVMIGTDNGSKTGDAIAMQQGNINVDVVTDALAQSTMRIMSPQYMTAGMGDGGACHPRDNIALRYMAQELGLGYDLFDAIMHAREIQAENLAKFLVEIANEQNMPIYIHGKAYKPQVPYLDGSYSLLVGHYCENYGFSPTYIDPYTGDDFQPDVPGVFLMAHSASVTYEYTGSSKTLKDELYCVIPMGSIVVDPWRKFESNASRVIRYGNTRKH